MKQAIRKQHILLLLVLLCGGIFCIIPHTTHAYFSGDASSTGAIFGAATLAVGITPTHLQVPISSTSSSQASFTVADDGSTAFTYALSATASPSCASDFYNGVTISAVHGATAFSGPLRDFTATSSSIGTWDVTFSASSSIVALQNETCDVVVTANAWQPNFTNASEGGFGSIATTTVTLTASENIGTPPAPTVVLNEIYPIADSATTTIPLDREWIELYNTTNAPIDVAHWAIGELPATGTSTNLHEIVASCPINGVSKYMEPYNTSSTVLSSHGLLVVQFCGSGSYLNDTGDTVSLYMSTSSTAIDSYTYSGDKPTDRSYARMPGGGTWVDPIPTPGMPNITALATSTDASSTEAGSTGGFEPMATTSSSTPQSQKATSTFGFSGDTMQATGTASSSFDTASGSSTVLFNAETASSTASSTDTSSKDITETGNNDSNASSTDALPDRQNQNDTTTSTTTSSSSAGQTPSDDPSSGPENDAQTPPAGSPDDTSPVVDPTVTSNPTEDTTSTTPSPDTSSNAGSASTDTSDSTNV